MLGNLGMLEMKVEPSDNKDGGIDHLHDLLGLVSQAWAKRVNETPMTAEQAEDISRRST